MRASTVTGHTREVSRSPPADDDETPALGSGGRLLFGGHVPGILLPRRCGETAARQHRPLVVAGLSVTSRAYRTGGIGPMLHRRMSPTEPMEAPSVLTCANCNTQNDPNRKFCVECGQRLAAACPACGSENPTGAKFCGECGTTLAGAGEAAGATATPTGQRQRTPVAAGAGGRATARSAFSSSTWWASPPLGEP